MKKYLIFCMELILSACATGGSPDDRFRVSSTSMYFRATKDAVDSNNKITSLKTEVPVCNGNCREITTKIIGTPSHPSVLNRKSTNNDGSNELTIYDLSDTEFNVSDNTTFTFAIDDVDKSATYGQITGIKIGDDKYSRSTETDETAKFTKDDATFTYNSFSKSNNLNLLYSDFGKIEYDNNETKYFVGGYKELKHAKPEQSRNFSGWAIGVGTKNSNTEDLNGSATLTFVAPTANTALSETLTMNFGNWGNVVVSKNGDNARQIKFDDGTPTSENLSADIGYYGAAASNVQEAAGRIKYDGTDTKMDVVFGTKKN